MELGRVGVVQEDAAVVVELDDDHGRLDAVVEGVRVGEPADPAEVRLAVVLGVLGQPDAPRRLREVQQVRAQDVGDERAVRLGHVGHQDALVRHDAVVAVRAAQVPLVVVVPPPARHGRVFHLLECLGFCLLLGWQGLHELEPESLLFLQDARAFVRAVVDLVRLRPREPRRHDHLRAAEEDVQAEVVAVETIPPGDRRGGGAEEHEVVAVLVHHRRSPNQVAEEPVDAHCRHRLLVPFRREGRPEDRKDAVTHRRRHLVQTEALVAEEELRVRPRPPLR